MNDFNPYAAPETRTTLDLPGLDEEGAWRSGRLLVMTRHAALPARCMKCNLPTEGVTLRRKLSWHPWYFYMLIFINLLIYLVIALIVRKTATVNLPICPRHRSQRRRSIAIGWLLGLGSIGVFLTTLAIGGNELVALGLCLIVLITGLVIGVAGTQFAVARKIDKQFIWLKNVNPNFLAALPPLDFRP